MQIQSIQSGIHTLLDRVVLERVFYERDPRTGATSTQAIEYVIQVYNRKGQVVEQSEKGTSVNVRA